MPTCAKYMLAKIDRLHKVEVYLSRFCYDVRLDENACGWRAKSFTSQPEKVTVYTGPKGDRDL